MSDPADRLIEAIVDRVLARLAERLEQTEPPPTYHGEPY